MTLATQDGFSASLTYSEEQIELMDVARNFCRDKSPIEKVRSLIDDPRGYDPDIWRAMADLGWCAVAIPEGFGGVGLSLAEVAMISEQMGRSLMATPWLATQLAIQALLAAGSSQQQCQWLPRLAEGAIAGMALAEDHGDWELSHITASASRNGETITLSGHKQFVTHGPDCALVLVSIMLDGHVQLALIEQQHIPQQNWRREIIIDERMRSHALTLDGITIKSKQLLNVERAGATLERIARAAALLQSAEICGATQAVIDYTIDYLQTRTQFGQPIGAYQALKHPIANAYVEYEKARSLMLSAACHADDPAQAAITAHMAKAASAKVYSYAADRAIQFHGGFGFTHDCDAQLYRRNAIWQESQYGDALWHRRKLTELLFQS